MNRKITIYLLATLLISIFIGTGARKSGCMFTNEKAKSVVSSFTLLSPSDRANSVTLTPTFVWTDFDSEKNYILQIERLNNIDDTPTFSSSLAYENTTIAANVTSFVMSAGKLSLATPYAWRILALNFHTLTNVEPSNRYFKFTTVLNEQQLTSPSSFTLTSPISGTEIRTTTPTFEWSNSVGETSYIFQISESITFIPLVYQDPDIIYDTTSYNGIPDGTLALNKDYYWRVIAHNDVGDTTASNAPFLIKIRGNPPGSFNLYKPDDDSIQYSLIPTLEWTPAGEAQSYTLEIAKTPFPTTPEYTALITPISSTAVVTYTVPAGVLFVRTKYYWRAKATNLAGDTYSTTYFHFTTFEQGIIPDPFDLTTPADNATDVSWRPELKWNDSIGEEYYVVQIDTNSNFTSTPLTFQITINKDTVSYKVPSGRLTPNIKYYWRVLATNSEGGRISGPIPYYWAFTTSNWTDFLSDTVGGEFLKRAYHTAVWTGPTGAGGTEEVIFWGGVGKESEDEPLTYFQDGYRYSPENESWTKVSDVNAPVSRSGHTAVWTGNTGTDNNYPNAMLIWGGWDGQTPLDSGAIYFPISNTWKAITTTGGTGAPSRRTEHTAVWTGPGTETWRNKMLVWGGTWPGIEYYNDGKIYDPLTDTWSDMKNATVSESWIEGYDQFGNPVWSFYGPMSVSNRAYHTAIWSSTTNEMLIWGGWNGVSFLNTGAKYSPGGDSWDAIADPLAVSLGGCSGSIPSARSGHTVVWSGGGMVMWGGQQFASYLGDYWTYNPLGTWPNPNNDSATGWESVTYTGTAPIARTEHTIVLWSDGPETKLIIWGGRNGINSTNYLNSGGLYNMFYAQWFAVSEDNAPSGRVGHTATWTGTKMVVWGGTNGTIYFNDGGKYNPTTASWAPVLPPQPIPIEPRMRHTAVWTGSVAENATGEMIVFGGQDFNQEYNNGGKYNPNGDIWSAISLRDAPISRTQHTAIWTGTVSNQMVIWGGYYRVGNLYLNSGGVYSPTSNTWVKMSELNAPSGRSNHTACWAPDRKEMLVWGGWDGSGWLDTGRQYYPITDTWNTTVITTTSAPAARTNHTAVWTGTQMIIWGGLNANNMPLDTGGRYTPSTDSWADTAIGGDVPISRAWHTAICRSDWPYDMIIWGGATNTDPNQAISSSNYKTLNSGALYSPLSNTWLALPTINAPASRTNHTAVWTQNWGTPVMIVWGGWDGNNYLNTGGKYNPANLTWSLIDSPPDFSSPPDFTGPPDGVPDFLGRVYHSSFWTGTEMIIFGGAVFGGPPPFGIPIGYTNTSAKYRP